MTDLWPCTRCGGRGVRNLGTEGWCALHLGELLATFDPAVFDLAGVGVIEGPARPDIFPGAHDLRCVACGATWVGAPLSPCPWCDRLRASMVRHSAELVMRPPDVAVGHPRREDALLAWADRLERAVAAELITRDRAEAALRREVNRGRPADAA